MFHSNHRHLKRKRERIIIKINYKILKKTKQEVENQIKFKKNKVGYSIRDNSL
jgi:hypothetical protein